MAKNPPQSPTARDITLAATIGKYDLAQAVANQIGKVLVIAALSLPLFAIYKIVQAIAGKETTVNVGVSIGMSLVIGATPASVAFLVQFRKMLKQREELIRCRERIATLEKALGWTSEGSTSGEKK